MSIFNSGGGSSAGISLGTSGGTIHGKLEDTYNLDLDSGNLVVLSTPNLSSLVVSIGNKLSPGIWNIGDGYFLVCSDSSDVKFKVISIDDYGNITSGSETSAISWYSNTSTFEFGYGYYTVVKMTDSKFYIVRTKVGGYGVTITKLIINKNNMTVTVTNSDVVAASVQYVTGVRAFRLSDNKVIFTCSYGNKYYMYVATENGSSFSITDTYNYTNLEVTSYSFARIDDSKFCFGSNLYSVSGSTITRVNSTVLNGLGSNWEGIIRSGEESTSYLYDIGQGNYLFLSCEYFLSIVSFNSSTNKFEFVNSNNLHSYLNYLGKESYNGPELVSIAVKDGVYYLLLGMKYDGSSYSYIRLYLFTFTISNSNVNLSRVYSVFDTYDERVNCNSWIYGYEFSVSGNYLVFTGMGSMYAVPIEDMNKFGCNSLLDEAKYIGFIEGKSGNYYNVVTNPISVIM